MCHSSGNIHFSSGSLRIPQGDTSTPDDQNILPHLLPLPREASFRPYLDTDDSAQNISVQFTGQDASQLDSDILQRRFPFNHETMAVPLLSYPESSQRTTSHALSPYAADTSRFDDFSSCDLATLHIVDAPLLGTHTPRRGSWPSHSQREYSIWMQSPPRTARSTASEPPESTSDESYQDSDAEEVIRMSPMMNQFQIQSSRNVNLAQQHMYHALQPSVMTFQLSETMMQAVDDPENRRSLRRLVDMNIVANDESEVTHPSPPPMFPSSPSTAFEGARWQGPSMRLQHDGERVHRTSQYRMPMSPPSGVPFPLPHSPANARVGDQRATGGKQPKKSKMHQCEQCKKMFPRPSGLATHLNSHTGAKPYKCIVANCGKTFAVRSNAKRHLRTHGINPSSPDALSIPQFMIGFEEPMVTQVHEAARQPSRYRWINQNPSPHEPVWARQGSPTSSAVDGGSSAGLNFQTSMSSRTSSSLSNMSDEDYEQVASSSVADVEQYQSDFNRGTDEFPGSYPSYGEGCQG